MGSDLKGGSLSLEAVSVGYGWRTSLLKSMCVQYRRTLYELCFLCYLESQVPSKENRGKIKAHARRLRKTDEKSSERCFICQKKCFTKRVWITHYSKSSCQYSLPSCFQITRPYL